jgi:hypothetical protein
MIDASSGFAPLSSIILFSLSFVTCPNATCKCAKVDLIVLLTIAASPEKLM